MLVILGDIRCRARECVYITVNRGSTILIVILIKGSADGSVEGEGEGV